MFNSLSDLNQQFAHFTSALSLDSMQEVESREGVTDLAESAVNQDASRTKTEHPNTSLSIKEDAVRNTSESSCGTTGSKSNRSIIQLESTVKSNSSAEVLKMEGIISELQMKNQDLEKELLLSSNTIVTLTQEKKLMEGSKEEVHRQYSELADELKMAKASNVALSKKTVSTEHELTNLHKSLRSSEFRYSELKENMAEQIQQRESELSDAKHRIGLNTKLISELQASNDKLKSDLEQVERMKLETEQKLSQVSASHETTHVESSKLVHDNISMKVEIDRKDKRLAELGETVSSLSDKLKGIMQRYAELKSNNEKIGQENEIKVTQLEQTLQEKESELLSLRLKAENTERTLNDLRLKSAELAERYGEAQREIGRLVSVLGDKDALLSEQASQLATISCTLADAEAANKGLQEKLRNTEASSAATSASRDEHYAVAIATLESEKHAAREQVLALQAELATASSRLNVETDLLGELESYKKRAQQALKKANNTSSQLSSENRRLQESLQLAERRVAELESCAEVKGAEVDDIRARMDDMRNELAGKAELLERLQTEVDSLLTARRAGGNEEGAGTTGRVSSAVCAATAAAGVADGTPSEVAAVDSKPKPPPVLVRERSEAATKDTLANAGTLRSETRTKCEPFVGKEEKPSTKHEDEPSPAAQGENCGSETTVGTAAVAPQEGYFKTSSGPAAWPESWTRVAARSSARPSIAGSSETPPVLQHGLADDDVAEQAGAAFLTSAEPDILSSTPSNYLLVTELHKQFEAVKQELTQRGIEVAAAKEELQYEREENRALKSKVEDLMAFLERAKKLHEGPDSAINMEYLKNCVFRFMCSASTSEKKRLYPVIATVLKLTSSEVRAVEATILHAEQKENEVKNAISSLGSFATNSLGGLWSLGSSLSTSVAAVEGDSNNTELAATADASTPTHDSSLIADLPTTFS